MRLGEEHYLRLKANSTEARKITAELVENLGKSFSGDYPNGVAGPLVYAIGKLYLESLDKVQILRGEAHTAGDGFKDTTELGDVVFVLNKQMPPPFQPGQFPRLRDPSWTATSNHFTFRPATHEELMEEFEWMRRDCIGRKHPES